MKKRSKLKHGIYLVLALMMLLYALPKLSLAGGMSWVFGFGVVWCAFAFLVIGAHLHFIIGVDEEKQKRLEAVRKEKAAQWGKWYEERVMQK